MKTTERFGLSLWELGDLIRMEDFNQNHQKIEEALEQLSQGGFQLYHGSAGGDSSLEFQIGLKKMGGWEDWNLLGLLLLAPDYEKRSGYSYFHQVGSGAGVRFEAPSPYGLYLFTPGKDPGKPVQGMFLSTDMVRFFQGTKTFQQVTSVACGGSPQGVITGPVEYFLIGIA